MPMVEKVSSSLPRSITKSMKDCHENPSAPIRCVFRSVVRCVGVMWRTGVVPAAPRATMLQHATNCRLPWRLLSQADAVRSLHAVELPVRQLLPQADAVRAVFAAVRNVRQLLPQADAVPLLVAHAWIAVRADVPELRQGEPRPSRM
jgi:hypothetical protein